MFLTQENPSALISVDGDQARDMGKAVDQNVCVRHLINNPAPKTMFQVGDRVQHQQTGSSGKVIGYGHEILNGVYLPTLKVRVLRATGLNQTGFAEDLSEAWIPFEG